MLHKEPPELCLSCHEKVTATVAGHTAHGALAGKDSCLHCHTTAHTSETEKFVPEPVATACYKCHDEELTTPSGKKIANVKAEIDAAKFKHGPVAKGECRGCHLSHSSPYRKLLSKKFTDKMYAEFAEPSFALCFSCHDKRVVTDERTALTSFRDGDRNLHHLHVNRKKGRTCGVCHEAHGSSQEGLIRESVPFGPGGWKLPIRFKKTPKGGTCASGCHQPLSYDNTKPPVDRKAHLLPAPTPLGRGGGTPPGGKSPKE
jgi:predicted CXXCH cytochrome family protein